MKKIILLLLITLSSQLNAQNDELEKQINNFNYDKILETFSSEEKTADSSRLMQLCFAVSYTADGFLGYGSQGLKYAEKSINYGLQVNPDKLQEKDRIIFFYYMAKMHNRAIVDASSWMKYGKGKDKYLKLLLDADPDHIGGNLIKISNLINMPESVGGNPEKGISLLNSLNEKYTSNYQILNQLAQYYLDKDNSEKAEEYLNKVIAVNPAYISAKNQLKELKVIRQNLKIRNIILKDGAKTNNKRILNKAKIYEGKIYNSENKKTLEEDVSDISSIEGIQIKSNSVSSDEVDLEIEASENNMRMVGTIGVFQINPSYDYSLRYMGIPALIYMDQNFMGTGDQLQIIYAGIFLKADYTLNGLFTDSGPVVKNSITSLFWTWSDEKAYKDGYSIDYYATRTPKYDAEIAIGKDMDIGLSAFIKNSLSYHLWKTDERNVNVPSNKFTYKCSLPLGFSTLDQENPSKLAFAEGFSISVSPEIVYKPGYRTWGNKYIPEYSFSHDDKPMFGFKSGIAYFTTFLERNNIGANLTYMTGKNFYQSEKWKAGSALMLMPSQEINGYYNDEFVFQNGLLLNLSYTFALIPGSCTVFLKHDILRNVDEKETIHGSALGTGFKLPFDVEVSAKCGIGWNAERENKGYGYDFQVSAMKLYFF